MKDLSIIIPILDEAESIAELVSLVKKEIESEKLSFEIIIIDDGSKDNSWEIVNQLKTDVPQIIGLQFRRNYGKSAALNEGFSICSGGVVITMDGDLQDNPSEILHLYKMIREEKYDLVSGWKKVRHDPLNKKIPSKLFNYVTRRLSGIQLHDFNCGLKAYSHELVKNIEIYGEMHRYIPLIAKLNGFENIGEKVVIHSPRKYGKTKYGSKRFIIGFLDLLSVLFITKFSKKPMHLFGTLGVLSFILGFCITVWLIANKLIAIAHDTSYRQVTDQPLFYIALVLSVIGVQLFLTGFVAELLSKNTMKRSYQIKNTIK